MWYTLGSVNSNICTLTQTFAVYANTCVCLFATYQHESTEVLHRAAKVEPISVVNEQRFIKLCCVRQRILDIVTRMLSYENTKSAAPDNTNLKPCSPLTLQISRIALRTPMYS